MKRILVGAFLAIAGSALVWLAIQVAIWVMQRVRQLDPNVSAAIIAALAAVVGAIYAQRQSRLREIEASQRADKVAAYKVFMDIVDHLTDESNRAQLEAIDNGAVPKEVANMFAELRRGLLVWASPQVIKAYEAFRLPGSTDPADVLLRADDVYRAIRKDLRNSNFGLARGDLVKLFLKDPSELRIPGRTHK